MHARRVRRRRERRHSSSRERSQRYAIDEEK